MGESWDCQQAMARQGKYNPDYQKFMKEHTREVGPIDTHMSESARRSSEAEKSFWNAVWQMNEQARKLEESKRNFR